MADTLATRHACRYQLRITGSHTYGDGPPKRRKCALCGGPLNVLRGLWGVFTWTGDGRYPAARAHATFLREADADAATFGELVVRWITETESAALPGLDRAAKHHVRRVRLTPGVADKVGDVSFSRTFPSYATAAREACAWASTGNFTVEILAGPASAEPRCYCKHSARKHVNGTGLCLVQSCKPFCLIYRPRPVTETKP